MQVTKYLPEKLYGFCQDASGFEVFFHLATFQPGADLAAVKCPTCPGLPHCGLNPQAPPPILGEEVTATFDASFVPGRAPRATRVVRDNPPVLLLGTVESFDPLRRYGFIQGTDQVSYHLHQSEVLEGRLPLIGKQATFFPGFREGRPRACHVRVCR